MAGARTFVQIRKIPRESVNEWKYLVYLLLLPYKWNFLFVHPFHFWSFLLLMLYMNQIWKMFEHLLMVWRYSIVIFVEFLCVARYIRTYGDLLRAEATVTPRVKMKCLIFENTHGWNLFKSHSWGFGNIFWPKFI